MSSVCMVFLFVDVVLFHWEAENEPATGAVRIMTFTYFHAISDK